MASENVIGAFSEEQASSISGVSVYQLRQWDRAGFFQPSYAAEQAHIPYGRLYSFRDLVSLQVLNDLRNEKRIPLRHLKAVSVELCHLGEQRWISTTLYVLGKRVVFDNPLTSKREEIVSGQRVFNIPLRVVVRNTRQRIREVSDRSDRVGVFEQNRFVSQNERVFAGSRIPVSSVLDFLRAGYSPSRILKEYPDLAAEDIAAVEAELVADVAA